MRVCRVIGIFVVEIEHDGRGRIMRAGFHSAFILATATSATATAAARTRRFITRISRMRRDGRRCARGHGCRRRRQRSHRGIGCRDLALGTLGCRLWLWLRLALLRLLRILALCLDASVVVRRTLVATLLLFVAAIA